MKPIQITPILMIHEILAKRFLQKLDFPNSQNLDIPKKTLRYTSIAVGKVGIYYNIAWKQIFNLES
jgi:hypothetical protein